MTRHLHTNRIPKHSFLNFVKPSFWTTLAWFCLDFTFPGIRTSMQKLSKSLPKRSIAKVLRKRKHYHFLKNNLKTDVQSALQRCRKICINPAPDHPGTPSWPKQSQKVAQKLKKCVLGMKMAPNSPTKITMRASQIFLRMWKRQDAQAKVALPLHRLQSIGALGADKFKGRRHEASAIKI